MRDPVVLNKIDSGYAARKVGLFEFAESFDHQIKPIFPTLVATRGGEIRAYAQIDFRALVTCAIHPKLNSPRDSLDLAKATISLLSQYHPGFLMNAPGQSDTLFTDKAMGIFGLKPWPNRIFYCGNEV